MKNHTAKARNIDRVRPVVHQDSREIQPYGTIAKLPSPWPKVSARRAWKISTRRSPTR